MHTIERATTMLFVPGSRPDRFASAVASGADVTILDLEDAVAPDGKDAARNAVGQYLGTDSGVAVRINGHGTPWFDLDLDVAGTAAAVVLAKAESPEVVAAVIAALPPGRPVLPLVETPRGLMAISEICSVPGVVRIAFGNVDFAAELGVDPASHAALAAARSQVVYASAAAGCAPPVDGVTTAMRDSAVLLSDAQHARELGFTAKLLIHPSQVASVAKIMAPTAEEVAWARAVLASSSEGVGVLDGHMVDQPVLRRARRILGTA